MRSIKFAIACLFTASTSMIPAAQAASIFDFQFDNQGLVFSGDGPLNGPIVGNGTFTSPTNLAPGTYDLSSLSGFGLNISFSNGGMFTAANITTPLTGAAVRIVDIGSGSERLFFTEGSGAGKGAGSGGGALDFASGKNYLSFEPTYAGGNFLYMEIASSSLDGRYFALSTSADVPEPATIALLGLGLLGFAASRRKSAK